MHRYPAYPLLFAGFLTSFYYIFFCRPDDDALGPYAALFQGPDGRYMSSNYLQNYSYRLGPDMRLLFQRWQQKHQFSLESAKCDKSGNVSIQNHHRIFTHKHKGVWHVAFLENYSSNVVEMKDEPVAWACFKP